MVIRIGGIDVTVPRLVPPHAPPAPPRPLPHPEQIRPGTGSVYGPVAPAVADSDRRHLSGQGVGWGPAGPGRRVDLHV